jgi:aspartokinase
MMTADPRKVQRTIPLRQLSYIEALELSHFGAKVLYPPSVQPVLLRNIPLKIKNTFHPTARVPSSPAKPKRTASPSRASRPLIRWPCSP